MFSLSPKLLGDKFESKADGVINKEWVFLYDRYTIIRSDTIHNFDACYLFYYMNCILIKYIFKNLTLHFYLFIFHLDVFIVNQNE